VANAPNALHDPTLSLFNIQGDQIFSNDNWKDTQQTDIEATTLAPTADTESASSPLWRPAVTPRSCAARTTLPALV